MRRAVGPCKRLRRAAAAAILLVAWGVSFAPGPARADFLGLGALFVFKAHKDEPIQPPVGQPLYLVAIAAALHFLPSLIGIGGNILPDGADVAAPLGSAMSCPAFDGAGTIQDRLRVDVGRELERHTRREVGLDQAGHDVRRRTLGRDHEVDDGRGGSRFGSLMSEGSPWGGFGLLASFPSELSCLTIARRSR